MVDPVGRDQVEPRGKRQKKDELGAPKPETGLGGQCLQLDDLSLAVLIGADQDQNKIDEGPNTATSQGKKLNNTRYDVPGIKTVNTKSTEEKAKQNGNYTILRTDIVYNDLSVLILRCSAIRANDCIIGKFLATILTKHSIKIR